MTLLGRGAITIWNDVRPEARENFYAWHDQEHIAERVGIRGFLRGRRYIATAAEVEFFTLYETVDATVMTGPDYKQRLENPTEWTRRSVPGSINVTRGLTEVVTGHGSADGGSLLAAGLILEDEHARAGLQQLADDMAKIPGICASHLTLSDRAASQVQTSEKRGRDKPADVPDAVVLVESSRPEGLEPAQQAMLASVQDLPAVRFLRLPGRYRLEFQIVKAQALGA
jgi:hypothetical protein